MHWVADEGVERQIVERLRAAGQDVLYVAELDPGISDTEVLWQSNEQGAVLITADKDFGELVFRQGQVMEGVVLLRHLYGQVSLRSSHWIVGCVARSTRSGACCGCAPLA